MMLRRMTKKDRKTVSSLNCSCTSLKNLPKYKGHIIYLSRYKLVLNLLSLTTLYTLFTWVMQYSNFQMKLTTESVSLPQDPKIIKQVSAKKLENVF